MHTLKVNPSTLQMAMTPLKGTPEELAFFHAALLQSNTKTDLYGSTPPPDADPATVSAGAVAAQGDWSRMVHPHVLAQLLVDLCAQTNQKVPDNTYVFVDNQWVLLDQITPALMTQTVLPPPPPVIMPPASTPLENLLHDVAYAPAAAPAAAPAPAQAPADGLRRHYATEAPAAAPAPAQAPAATPAPAPEPEAPAASYPPVGDFGLPAPIMLAPKGKSPFDTDPGGKVPSSPPDRVTRDIVQLVEGLFAKPASEVVGRGKGSTQRLRAYMAALQLVDCALASVPDGNCPVAYLRFHISHLRFNAGATAAGPTMLAFENHVFKPSAAEGE